MTLFEAFLYLLSLLLWVVLFYLFFLIIRGDVLISKYRRKVSRRGSKRLFTATASRTHIKNSQIPGLMRGGIRM